MSEPEELRRGDPFGYSDRGTLRLGDRSAGWLNTVADGLRRGLPSGSGLDRLGMEPADRRRPILARLSGSTSPYSWVEVYANPDGPGWLNHPGGRSGSANAFEVNAVASLSGAVVQLRPGASGDYRFQHARIGTVETTPAFCEECEMPETFQALYSRVATTFAMTRKPWVVGNLDCEEGVDGVSGSWDSNVQGSGTTWYRMTLCCSGANVSVRVFRFNSEAAAIAGAGFPDQTGAVSGGPTTTMNCDPLDFSGFLFGAATMTGTFNFFE